VFSSRFERSTSRPFHTIDSQLGQPEPTIWQYLIETPVTTSTSEKKAEPHGEMWRVAPRKGVRDSHVTIIIRLIFVHYSFGQTATTISIQNQQAVCLQHWYNKTQSKYMFTLLRGKQTTCATHSCTDRRTADVQYRRFRTD